MKSLFKSCCRTILFASYLDHWLNRPLAKRAVQSKRSLVVPASFKKTSNTTIFAGLRHAVALLFSWHGFVFKEKVQNNNKFLILLLAQRIFMSINFLLQLILIILLSLPLALTCNKDSVQQLFLQLIQIIWMSQPLAKKGVQNNIFCE